MGLTEVIRHLPRLSAIRRQLLQQWRREPPDLFVGIDAPDFNLGLARRLRARGTPSVQYVCPSVWAWRQGRVKKIRRAVDRVLCLLPFEPEFLAERDVAATFVGHPLADQIPTAPDAAVAKAALGMDVGVDNDHPLIALAPGSRMGEVTRLGADFLRTAAWLAERRDGLRFIAPMAGPDVERRFRDQLQSVAPALDVRVVRDATHSVFAAADLVLIASGTATLEAALYGKPMVVAYRVSGMTYRLVSALNLIKLKHFSLPNILVGSEIVPEFRQDEVTAETLGPALIDLLDNEVRRAAIRAEFAKLHAALARGADDRAAEAVLAMLATRSGA